MMNALWKSSFGFRDITEQKVPESGKPSHWWKYTGADSGSEDGEKWQWGRESIPSKWNGLQDVMKHVKAFHSPWISVVLYCWDFVWSKWGCAVVHVRGEQEEFRFICRSEGITLPSSQDWMLKTLGCR